jgi:hypothetical protein
MAALLPDLTFSDLLGQPTGPYSPLTLAPGQTGTITVTITPDAAAGTVIHGLPYVDAVNANSCTLGSITRSGDELSAIPYTYTVGAATLWAPRRP